MANNFKSAFKKFGQVTKAAFTKKNKKILLFHKTKATTATKDVATRPTELTLDEQIASNREKAMELSRKSNQKKNEAEQENNIRRKKILEQQANQLKAMALNFLRINKTLEQARENKKKIDAMTPEQRSNLAKQLAQKRAQKTKASGGRQ